MAVYNNAKQTVKGRNLENLIREGAGSLEFVCLKTGAGVYSEDEKEGIRDAAGLKDERQTFCFSSVKVVDDEYVSLKTVITNAGLAEGYAITEVGVFARIKGTEEVVLYSISLVDEADYLPAYEGERNYEILLDTLIKANDTENVSITYKHETYARAEELAEHMENQNNPHGVTKAQVGLGNVNNTSDADKPISTATQAALNEVKEKAEKAESIARGRNQAHVFATTEKMQEWLSNADNKGLYNKGDNMYIVDVGVPDWWIAEVLEEADADTGYYYKIAQLETQKVDLTEILSDIDELEEKTAGLNLKTYTELSQIGLSSGVTMADVYAAMPDKSTLQITGSSIADYPTDDSSVTIELVRISNMRGYAKAHGKRGNEYTMYLTSDGVLNGTWVKSIDASNYTDYCAPASLKNDVSYNTKNITNFFGWMPFGWELHDTITGFTADNGMTVEYKYSGVTPLLFYQDSGLLAIGNGYRFNSICTGAGASVSMPSVGTFKVSSGSGAVYVYKLVQTSMLVSGTETIW